MNLKRWLVKFNQDESGTTAVEYSVMLTLIVLVCLSVIMLCGDEASGIYDNCSSQISVFLNN